MNFAQHATAPKLLLKTAVFLIFLLNSGAVSAQPTLAKAVPAEQGTLEDRSVFDEIFLAKSDNITIETDLDALVSGKMRSDWQPGRITFGKKQSFKIELRPRGKFRRKVCEFPPLKVKFSKKELAAVGLSGLNDFKLTTHCADSEAGDHLLAREVLAYKMYAALTGVSLRSRLVDVTYVDSKTGEERFDHESILIESDEELAHRLGAVSVDSLYNLPPDSLNLQLAATTALFNFMIGNTDWSISSVRNIKMLRPASGGKICPVPYDFDFSGFVNASYASPNSFPIKSIRERWWQGGSLPPGAVKSAAQLFRKKRMKFQQIIADSPIIDEAQKADLANYVESFFDILDQTKDLPTNKPAVAGR